MGLKEQILAANDLPTMKVSVPEWGCDLHLRVLSGRERDSLEAESVSGRGKSVTANMENFRARLVVRAVCDEAGGRVFDDADAPALGKKSGVVLNRLYAAAASLNDYSAKDVEEIAKN